MVLRGVGVSDDAEVRVGRFVVRGHLGRGGMGDVFRAHDPHLDREVALKVLDPRLESKDPETLQREARALARLTHPNVVSVYEMGIEGDQIFVAMEYVPGRTVREHALRQPPPTWQELVGLFLQAGMGLLAAHEAGLVHRDIKPDNLLVREDGRVLVADFGLARPGDGGGSVEISGTPGFLAPEVVARGAYSAASDQFAFCASLWRVLDPSTPPGTPSERIPPTVRHVLTRGLSQRPDQRWPSMREVVASLRDSLDLGPDARHRMVLLDRVERLWIQGVLHASLMGAEPLPLTLSDAGSRVDPPWGRALPIAAGTRNEASPRDLPSLLERAHGALLVLGEPGSGKTLLLLQLAEVLIDAARLDPVAPAPVVLNLASLGPWRGSVEAWVERELVAKYNLPRRNAQRWLESGALTLLLDGLDEVKLSQRRQVVQALNSFRASHGLAMVVTCRTSDQDAAGARLAFGHAVLVDPLPAGLVQSHLGTAAGAEVEPPESLRTPLMVSLLRGEQGPVPANEDVVPWLIERHIAHVFRTRQVSPERQQRLRGALAVLAAAMNRDGRTELWVEELDPAWVFADGRRTVARVLAVVLLLGVTISVNTAVGWWVEGDAFSGLVFGLCSAPMVLAFNRGLRSQPVERLRFSVARMLRLAPLSVGLGAAAGAVYGLFYVVWNNVVFGAAAGLVTLFTLSFEPALREGSLRPNQGMRQSLMNGVAIGTLGFVAAAFTFGVVVVPAVLPYLDQRSSLVGLPHPAWSAAAIVGPMVGLISGMVQGGWAVLVHVATRVVLAATSAVPLRLVPLLDEAVELSLLRRIGGGYLFAHRTFQQALAAPEEAGRGR